jgi:hypothetical protein
VLIGTREWFQKCGYFWCPAYVSIACDDDMTAQATKEGALVDAKDLVFAHDWQGPERDETQKKSYSSENWEIGRSAMNRRGDSGFPMHPEAWGDMGLAGNLDYFSSPAKSQAA